MNGGCGGGGHEASTRTSPATAAPVTVVDRPLPPIVAMDAAGAKAIPAGNRADWVIIAANAAWIANVGGGVRRYDVSTAAELGTTPVPGYICQAMDIGFHSLWVVDCDHNTVVRIDVATGTVTATIDPGIGRLAEEASIAVDESGVYVMCTEPDHRVAHIDPATNAVAGTFTAPSNAAALRAGFDSLWFSRAAPGELTRVDPVDGSELSTVVAGAGARFLAVGADAVWVLANIDGTVTRVDRNGKAVARIKVADRSIEGGDIAVGGGFVWARVTDAVVAQIDPVTNTVVRRVGEPAGSGSVAADEAAAWISAHDVATVWRLPL
jgi:DNA-binding beta-propeller fold protein YncE